jgi:hypothetical protein
MGEAGGLFGPAGELTLENLHQLSPLSFGRKVEPQIRIGIEVRIGSVRMEREVDGEPTASRISRTVTLGQDAGFQVFLNLPNEHQNLGPAFQGGEFLKEVV